MPLLKTAKRTTTHPRLEDFEDVVEARTTLDKLKTGLNKALATETEANAKLREKAPTTEERARQLIREGTTAGDGVDWQAERRKAFENREVYERAVKEQANTLRLVEGQRSRDVCAAVEPEYRVLVQDVINAIGVALVAEGKARKFKTALEQEGVLQVHHLLPVEPVDVGGLTAWLERARAQGYDA